MICFTSDLQLGHSLAANNRAMFSTIKEMDDVLIENWNDTVKARDTVIITGDMFYRNEVPAEEYLFRMKGKKILVMGNHDRSCLKDFTPEMTEKFFAGVYNFYEFKKDGVKLRFCHCPMISWEGSRYGSILVCGHIHNANSGYEYDMFRQVPNAFNAGVDINGYKPVSMAELIENNVMFYKREFTEKERAVAERAVEVIC